MGISALGGLAVFGMLFTFRKWRTSPFLWWLMVAAFDVLLLSWGLI